MSEQLSPRLSRRDGGIVILQFWLGDRPLSVTKYWRSGPQIVAPLIAKAVQYLAGSDRLILSPSSAADYERELGGRRVSLSAQQAIYVDYVLTHRAKDWAFSEQRWQEIGSATLAVELEPDDSTAVTVDYFDSLSYRGFIVPRANSIELNLLLDPNPDPAAPFEYRRLPKDVTWFEDADDGCALKIGSGILEPDAVESRLNLPRLDEQLQTVTLPTVA